MLDKKDFDFSGQKNGFDLKSFLLKIVSYWKWFVLSLLITFTIAYQVNIRKQKSYAVNSTISIKEENNPFFTANTSLVFNWGGTSDQINTIVTTLKSRTHNEFVVDKMNYFIDYSKQDKYFETDVYGQIPFFITLDKKENQLVGKNIEIEFLNQKEYRIKIEFDKELVSTYNYSKNKSGNLKVQTQEYSKTLKIGERIALPFLHWILDLKEIPENYINSKYLVKLNNFDDVVQRYQDLKVIADEKNASVLRLSLEGTNKARMVDYLNETVNILIKNELDKKNLFATNTIKFIDSTLIETEKLLKTSGEELKSFQKGKSIINIEDGGAIFSEKLQKYDVVKDEISRQINYYNSLKSYLQRNNDFSKLPAPSVAGITEPNIVFNVSKLVSLSVARAQMAYSVKNEKLYSDFDNEMESIKLVLLENINSSRNALNYDLALANSSINEQELKLKRLPQDKQELAKIERKYNLGDNVYNNFLAKKSEAEIVKAANLSDIHFIDSAKDTGGGLLESRTSMNYVIAFFSGILIPLLFILGLFFVNTSIQNVEDISKITQIPLLGVVGKKHQKSSNLAVFEKPKSALSESFRAIRSSLQFLYKKQNVEGSKTLMLTSSVGGEGKTFCSVNIATIFALSDKKTVIVGLDLRKPKIFNDFDLKNDFGVVNYLIGQKKLSEIVQKTQIPNLDVITSGPIPPNPAELIIGDSMTQFMNDLKANYDYIILDTPPVGLVADSIELVQYCDVILYIIRQNYTKKEMITMLNNRVERGELSNVSIVLNGFESKAKYGNAYGYGYGYGEYANGYHEVEKPKTWIQKINDFLSNS
jgi:polysaccharide biosynthesis transport protein